VVSGLKEGGDEGVVREAVLRGHFVEQAVGVTGVKRRAAHVHEEDGVGGWEGGGDVARFEEELVELPASGRAAGAEELDAGGDVDGDGHDGDCRLGHLGRGRALPARASNVLAAAVPCAA
jgi:hypothetical protein